MRNQEGWLPEQLGALVNRPARESGNLRWLRMLKNSPGSSRDANFHQLADSYQPGRCCTPESQDRRKLSIIDYPSPK
jgi:hypothetical protein